jgi:hypothetical protein
MRRDVRVVRLLKVLSRQRWVIGVGEHSRREDTWACTMIPSSVECLSAARDGPETSFDMNPSDEASQTQSPGGLSPSQ